MPVAFYYFFLKFIQHRLVLADNKCYTFPQEVHLLQQPTVIPIHSRIAFLEMMEHFKIDRCMYRTHIDILKEIYKLQMSKN